jgi:PAS domain S-box-containing protein
MLIYCIVIFSILIQLAAAIQALRLIKITGKQLSWALIAIAMALQASRRMFTLIGLIHGDTYDSLDLIFEWIGLTVSLLMLTGVATFGAFLHKSKTGFKERKQAEDALRAEKELFQKTFDFSPLPSFLLRLPERTVVRVNPAFEKLFGYTRAEITGRPVDEFELWADHVDRRYIRDEIYQNGKINDHEFVFKTKSGDTGYGLFYSETIVHISDKFVLVKVMDITHHVQTQEALLESESKFRKLYEEGPFGMAYINKEFRYMTANQTYIDMFGYSEDELQQMTFKDITHPDDINIDLPYIQQLIKKEIPVYKTDKRYIRKNGQVIWGSLTVTSNYSNKGKFLYNLAMVEDISDRKATYEKVLKSEERYRELIEQASDGIFISDGEGLYVDVNTAGCNLLGYTREEILQKSLHEITAASLETPIRLAELRSGKSFLSEREMIRKDGTYIPVEISAKQLSNGHFQGIARDITERKKAENELKASEERFRYTLENMLEGAQIIGFDWKYIYINRQAEIHNRRPNEELIGKKYMDICPGIEETEVFRQTEKVLNEKVPCQMENEFVYPNGSVGWFDLSIQPIPEGVFILSIDVTERRLAEKSLRQSEEKLRTIFDVLPVGISLIDHDRLVVQTNAILEETIKLNYEDLYKGNHKLRKYLRSDGSEMPPEELASVQAINGNKVIRDVETGIETEDGSIFWTSVSAAPLNVEGLSAVVVTIDINARKQSELALKESETKLRSILENTQDAIGVSKNGIALFSNPAYIHLFGFEEEEQIIGKPILEIISPKEHNRIKEYIRKRTAGEAAPTFYETIGIRKNGEEFPFEGRFSTYNLNDQIYTIAIIRDISERRKAEETLRESRAKLEAALASMTDAVFISNNAGEFIEFNDAFATFHKFKNKNECAKTLAEYPDFLEVYMENGEKAPLDMWAVPRALRGETATNAEYLLRRKDTGETWVGSYSFSPIRDKDDNVVGSVVVGRDITERKRGEEEILKLNSELEQRVIDRTSQLANANKELEAFSYSVSHDLRAPLRGIDGFSLALFEDYYNDLDDTAKNYIERIRNATKKMDGLIDSLLTLARISRLEMNLVKVNLSDIVRGIANGLTEGDKSRKAQFIIPEKITAMGDPNLLKIVLENLLNNAWKFTSKKENTIIEFGALKEKSKTTYYIKDNGIGFDMQYANKLFSAFQRLHSDKEYPGTGVGLTTVQRIIRRHNGDIHAESKLNEGTTFYFTL